MTPDAVGAADHVAPYRTVFVSRWFALRLTATPGDRPAAPVGILPARSFADTWARLPAHPDVATADGPGFDAGTATDASAATASALDTSQRAWLWLDGQLRRIRSWSAALQYAEDYMAWRAGGDGP